jgi:hypothetical protein
MKNLLLGCVLAMSATLSFADDATPVIAQARAGELSTHRIERLVNLKKIDASFISKLQTIEVEKLKPSQAGDPTFLATVSQYAGADGTKNQVEISMDDQGKALSFKVKTGTSAQNAPVWTDKDPSTLVENALHFVLDHNTDKPDVKPFYDSLLSINLSKKTVNGQDFALVLMTAKDTQTVLNVLLKLDGTFSSYEIK